MSNADVVLSWAHDEWPDGKRHGYVVDNDDWDSIIPTLKVLEDGIREWSDIKDEEEMQRWKTAVRVVFEVLYIMGVKRGEAYAKET